MDLFLLFLIPAAGLAIWRVVYQVRRASRIERDDWDTKFVERLRRSGVDPFRPMEIDFFVALPTRDAAERLQARLQREGYTVDVREIGDSPDHPFSLHALKAMHLTVDNVRASASMLREQAIELGGRFDGWAPGRKDLVSDAPSDV